MGRREDELSQPVMRKVTLNPVITALVPGLCYIRDVWVEVDHTKVKEVEVGKEFHILCDYHAENQGGITWLSCATAIGDGIKNYEDTKVTGSKVDHIARLGNMGSNIMPNKDITLTVKVWMHDNYWQSPPYPPTADWD